MGESSASLPLTITTQGQDPASPLYTWAPGSRLFLLSGGSTLLGELLPVCSRPFPLMSSSLSLVSASSWASLGARPSPGPEFGSAALSFLLLRPREPWSWSLSFPFFFAGGLSEGSTLGLAAPASLAFSVRYRGFWLALCFSVPGGPQFHAL